MQDQLQPGPRRGVWLVNADGSGFHRLAGRAPRSRRCRSFTSFPPRLADVGGGRDVILFDCAPRGLGLSKLFLHHAAQRRRRTLVRSTRETEREPRRSRSRERSWIDEARPGPIDYPSSGSRSASTDQPRLVVLPIAVSRRRRGSPQRCRAVALMVAVGHRRKLFRAVGAARPPHPPLPHRRRRDGACHAKRSEPTWRPSAAFRPHASTDRVWLPLASTVLAAGGAMGMASAPHAPRWPRRGGRRTGCRKLDELFATRIPGLMGGQDGQTTARSSCFAPSGVRTRSTLRSKPDELYGACYNDHCRRFTLPIHRLKNNMQRRTSLCPPSGSTSSVHRLRPCHPYDIDPEPA